MDTVGHNVCTGLLKERYDEEKMPEAQSSCCWNSENPAGCDVQFTQVYAPPTEELIQTTGFADYDQAQTNLDKSKLPLTDFALYAQDYAFPNQALGQIPMPATNFAHYAQQHAQSAPLPLGDPCLMPSAVHTQSCLNKDYAW
jgi:hypothetical protein